MVTFRHRLRPHPEVRFARNRQVFDLRDAFRDLLQETNSGQHGHRQMALFRHGPMTVAIYHFQPGSQLPHHVVDGEVIYQVLKGRVHVGVNGQDQPLEQGMLYTLASCIPHDLRAEDESEMTMTVYLRGRGSHALPRPDR